MYLPLLLELLLESSVEDGEDKLTHEEVVAALEEQFLTSTASIGVSGREDRAQNFWIFKLFIKRLLI